MSTLLIKLAKRLCRHVTTPPLPPTIPPTILQRGRLDTWPPEPAAPVRDLPAPKSPSCSRIEAVETPSRRARLSSQRH